MTRGHDLWEDSTTLGEARIAARQRKLLSNVIFVFAANMSAESVPHRIVVLAIDESDFSEYAFDCEYIKYVINTTHTIHRQVWVDSQALTLLKCSGQ